MKQFLKYLAFVIVFANVSLLVSCNSDDHEVELSNFFMYDGQTIKTPSVFSDLTVDDEEVYTEIGFLSEHLTYEIVKNGGDARGSALLINKILAEKDGTIIVGTHELDEASLTIDANWNSYDSVKDNTYQLVSGVVVILKSGEEYTIDYNLEFPDNKAVVGTYTGKLELYQ